MTSVEINFDGLVGPTHHYGGLSPGNVASKSNRLRVSRPRAAALQGLAKMKLLADRGIPQGVLPPQRRPHFGFLRAAGLTGSDAEVLEQAARTRGDLLSIACSASSMWAANAATVSPGPDTADGRVHFTPANLTSTPHRRLEASATTALLRGIFADGAAFVIHEPLPAVPEFADEGAANHLRLTPRHGAAGLEIFVYGRAGSPNSSDESVPRIHPARQTREAGEAIARTHGLRHKEVMFVRQTPAAIDAGVFHNDVIAVANERVLLCHAQAFVDQPRVLSEIRERFPDVQVFEVSREELTLEEAVESYLFNGQLVTLPDDRMLLLCPEECLQRPRVRAVLSRLRRDVEQITEIRGVDVRQSMKNGGGPACLRLRVVVNDAQRTAIPTSLLLNDSLYHDLTDWITRHYRETLVPADLADPGLPHEVAAALDELPSILGLTATAPEND